MGALLSACADDSVAPAPSPSMAPSVATITFSNDRADEPVALLAEIADTSEERTRGLMFRDSLPEDRGMIFKFEAETSIGFWMKNTTIPLSIAFISSENVILDIQDMEPLSLVLHHASEPYTLAVEVNQGWFELNGVRVGSVFGWLSEPE